MKNKKLLYLLVPAVIGIWGAIVYKIVTKDSGDEAEISFANIAPAKAEAIAAPQDTFRLLLPYRDPFLTSYKRRKRSSSTASTSATEQKKAAAQKAAQQMSWPDLSYGGMIKNHKSSEKVALVRINATDRLLREKEEFDELKLLAIRSDSIIVEFQKEKRVFYK